MASPVVDTGTNAKFTIASFSGGPSFSSAASVFQTSGANQVAIAVISFEGNAARSVSTFTITAGGNTLTFALIASAVIQGIAAVDYQTIEVWKCAVASAYNGAAAATTTAMTMSGVTDDAFVSVFSIQGCADINSPLDPNVSFPAKAVNSSGAIPPTLTYTTTNPDDLLIFASALSGASTGSTPSGWTLVSSGLNGGGAKFQGQRVSYKSVSSVQTSQTVADPTVANSTWAALALAFTSNPAFSTETGTAVLGFSGISFVGAGKRQETATGTLAFSGISFVGVGNKISLGGGNLAFSGISFVGLGKRNETGVGIMAFSGISFVGSGSVIHVKGTGNLAFGGISISASGFNAGVAGNGLRQFWTC